MRGDFSTWNKDGSRNFRGTLHQQGRVLIDRDWNAQTEINIEWQQTAGRDAFGAGVAAVPAELPQGFKVTGAKIVGSDVLVAVSKGRVWADGLLVESPKDISNRIASYLNLPPKTLPNPNAAPRDAVILESWLEELNPFQATSLLIEPALGGVDTTERVQTAFRFRLFRMESGDTCDSILPKLADDFSAKGKLTVKLDPFTDTGGDCPVVESGGYTGFEHRLYRIEIAETAKAGAWFKWSQFNGGLVGTGDFDAPSRKVSIHGNLNAILHCGVSEFYFEALDLDDATGYWRVAYAAKATLGPDNKLALPTPAHPDEFLGPYPPAPVTGKRFFRLWNGIEPIADYVTAEKDLPDLVGIKLKFDTTVAAKYTPSDFWTFQVRAGEIGNPAVLVGDPVTFVGAPPQGILYHRVPLAEIMWSATGVDIEDCRRIFLPLTKLKTCCTYRVGDGVHSHGEFTRIQDAINALPKSEGGEVCILPGVYTENIVLDAPHNRNILLKGCGKRTVLRSGTKDPVIRVQSGQNIHIESLAVEANEDGIGILLNGEEKTASNGNREKYLKDITLSELFITAAKGSAIKAFVAQCLTLNDSVIQIKDAETREIAVYLAGDDMLVKGCEIRVVTEQLAKLGEATSNDLNHLYPAKGAPGGLQIAGGSERVRILDNLIVSGTRNGITLGSVDLIRQGHLIRNHIPIHWIGELEDCCKPDDGFVDDGNTTEDGSIPVAGPPLEDILIQANRIFNMGRNGIGVVTFFSLGDKTDPKDVSAIGKNTEKGVVSVSKLVICENRIERCLNSNLQEIPEKFGSLMGYGGISLADTEAFVVRDNFIIDNGPDFLEPICGIFVLSGQGIEISRNHILNNGMRNQKELNAKTVKRGPRGGIYIAMARTSGIDVIPGSDRSMYFASGFPAAKIHDNCVTVPLGRSLTLIANGPVSVIGNRFTSFGLRPINFLSLILSVATQGSLKAELLWDLIDLIAGNIFIFNQGMLALIPAMDHGFKNIQSGTAANAQVEKTPVTLNAVSLPKNQVRYFATGTVLFTNNQCHQNLATPAPSFALSSICIASLDDVGFHTNQCDCDLDQDFLMVNAFIFGMTARISDNRFRESLMKVFFSAATFGMQVITTDNESIHCLLVLGTAYLKRHNLVLLEIGTINGDITKVDGPHVCDNIMKLFKNFGIPNK